MRELACLFLTTTLLIADPRLGEKIYLGAVPLSARIAGSSDELSPAAAKCVNCHGSDARGVTEGELRGSDIRTQVLQTAARRRGGPPSRYDRLTFCAALRSGHDPAGVVLARGMPRYRIPTIACTALWNYLEALQSKEQ